MVPTIPTFWTQFLSSKSPWYHDITVLLEFPGTGAVPESVARVIWGFPLGNLPIRSFDWGSLQNSQFLRTSRTDNSQELTRAGRVQNFLKRPQTSECLRNKSQSIIVFFNISSLHKRFYTKQQIIFNIYMWQICFPCIPVQYKTILVQN